MSGRTQQFSTRNAFYLRISPTTVLHFVLYLDQRHVDGWMSSEVLDKVLFALKPRIVTKLGAERGTNVSKRRRELDSEKVDVYRGAGWQMAYFFRKTANKHAVLVKDKQVTFEPYEKPADKKEDSAAPGPISGRAASSRPTRQSTRRGVDIEDDDGVDDVNGGRSRATSATRSSTAALQDESDYIRIKDEEEDEDTFLAPRPPAPPLFVPEEVEDEKPEGKPRLRVSYNGFSIFGKTLVVIVEPYPPLRGPRESEAPSERELSHVPLDRERSESAFPNGANGDERFRSRSTSSVAPRQGRVPLFRPETPIDGEEDGQAQAQEDLDRFRLRSQSVLGGTVDGAGSDEE